MGLAHPVRQASRKHHGEHQAFVGAGYFDKVAEAAGGVALSTAALAGSTEEEQFTPLPDSQAQEIETTGRRFGP
jgi:hypothetical protein